MQIYFFNLFKLKTNNFNIFLNYINLIFHLYITVIDNLFGED